MQLKTDCRSSLLSHSTWGESAVYLWRCQQDAQTPRHCQHASVPHSSIQRVQWMENRPVSVQADHDQDEGRRVHCKQLKKTHQLAHDVACIPLHCNVPHGIQWHHNEAHHQVCCCQAGNDWPQVSAKAVTTAPKHADQDRRVARCSKYKKHQGGGNAALCCHREGWNLPRWRRRRKRRKKSRQISGHPENKVMSKVMSHKQH